MKNKLLKVSCDECIYATKEKDGAYICEVFRGKVENRLCVFGEKKGDKNGEGNIDAIRERIKRSVDIDG